jgi:phage tail-like protein
VQAKFDPQDTTGLSAAFRSKPVAGGLLAVFSGGRRADRFFTAWLMAGELSLPLVQAAVAVPGCVSFVDGRPVSATKPPPDSAIVWSLDDPAPDVERSADLVVHFSAVGRPNFSPPPATPRVADDDRIDPCCNFNVVIDGRSHGFSEVTALACVAHGSRGTTYPNIVLRRAITLNKDLYEWRMNIVNGQADARSMAVSHLSTAAEAVRTWWIEGAWPVRWSAPSFDSMAARPAMEEIEICVSRFEWR